MVTYKKKGKAVVKSAPKKAATSGEQSLAIDAAPAAEPEPSSHAAPTAAQVTDNHPLPNGSYLVVKYRDGSNRLAKVIEGNNQTNAATAEYYIHYCDFNRRMDEWIKVPRIVLFPSEANILGTEREAAENAAKKLKSIDSKGNLVDMEQKPGDNVSSPPLSSPRSLLGSGNQRSGQKSRSNSIIGIGGVSQAISTVADMDHDEHEGTHSTTSSCCSN